MTFKNAEYELLAAATETGDAVAWPGGAGTFTVYAGTFSGATVSLEWTPDDGTTWLAVDSGADAYVTLTEAGAGNFDLPACSIRAAISGTPSGIYAKAFGIPG